MAIISSVFKFLFVLFWLPLTANAYFLDYFKLQHAGEIGELAAGFGKRFNKVYSLDYMHGYVREETGGSDIITIALKNNFDFYRLEYNKSLLELYAGVNVFHVTGLRYQASRNNNYPDSYYSIGSIRGLLYLGARGSIDANGPHQAFFESGVNDLWIINEFNNSEAISIKDYVSLALGYIYLF